MFQTPKRRKLSTKVPGNRNVTPNGRVLKVKSENGADKEPVNGRSPGTERNDSVGHLTSPSETKRGRPRAESLNSLILMGSTSPSSIKCSFCQRVFPRDKSLQAHLRTHTGWYLNSMLRLSGTFQYHDFVNCALVPTFSHQ